MFRVVANLRGLVPAQQYHDHILFSVSAVYTVAVTAVGANFKFLYFTR